jgi:VanZ family protein
MERRKRSIEDAGGASASGSTVAGEAELEPHRPRFRRNRDVKRDLPLLRAWVPVVVWSAIIVLESMFGSAANTGGLLEKLAGWSFGQVDPARFDAFHHILRKAGHFIGYGVLGYLCFRAFLQTLRRMPPMTGAALAILCASFAAALDELHQSFTPGREGQFQDVALDASGAVALVCLATTLIVRRHMNPLGAGTLGHKGE